MSSGSRAGMYAASPRQPVFSPDGRFLLVVDSTQGVEVLDLSDPAKPSAWGRVPEQTRSSVMIKFAPDGRRVLIATARTAHIWDIGQPGRATRIAAFDNLPQEITGIDHWPSTGQFVMVTSGMSLWPLRVDADQVIREMCLGGAELSDDQWANYFPDVERVPVC